LPDLPTIAESGYPAFESLAWNGVLVPAATPKAVVARLNAEIDAILKQPDVVQKLNALGFELVGGTPEQFAAIIQGESEKWAPIIKSANIKID
jgi:tripartite-type tricarboxylate transporter receptor subunit TctC